MEDTLEYGRIMGETLVNRFNENAFPMLETYGPCLAVSVSWQRPTKGSQAGRLGTWSENQWERLKLASFSGLLETELNLY